MLFNQKSLSSHTKLIQTKYWMLVFFDVVCLYLPLIIYLIIAVANSETPVSARIALVACIMISGVLALLNAMTKVKLRSPRWIILVGLYIAVQEMLLPLIIIMGVTTIADDFFFGPLITHYRTTLIASKTFDAREGINGAEQAEPEQNT